MKVNCPTEQVSNSRQYKDMFYKEYNIEFHKPKPLYLTYKFQSKRNPSIVTAIYDLHNVLTTPRSEVSLFYYRRKFAVYNFTILNLGKSKGYSYVWNETTGCVSFY